MTPSFSKPKQSAWLLEIPNAVHRCQPCMSLIVVIGLSAVELCIFLLMMTVAGHHHEHEYGYSPFITISFSASTAQSTPSHKSLAHVGSPLPSFFPASCLISTLYAVIASSKLSFIPVFCSPCQMLNIHGTRRSTLLPLQSQPCVSIGVQPAFCVSLGAMLCEDSSLRMCTLNGMRPSLVRKSFCHVFAILIPFHSTRLSCNPLGNTYHAITATSPFKHYQSSISPWMPYSSLIIIQSLPSNALSSFWSPSF